MAAVYRSKIDLWIAVVLVLSIVVSIAGAGMALHTTPTAFAWLISLLIVVVGGALPVWIITTTYYQIDGRVLFISSGPVRLSVPIENIVSITPSSDLLSSPALSLDRLRIDYGLGKSVMISPRDKEGFIRTIEAIQSSAWVDQNRVASPSRKL